MASFLEDVILVPTTGLDHIVFNSGLEQLHREWVTKMVAKYKKNFVMNGRPPIPINDRKPQVPKTSIAYLIKAGFILNDSHPCRDEETAYLKSKSNARCLASMAKGI